MQPDPLRKGTITVTTPGGAGPQRVTIRLADAASGTIFAEVELTFEDFTRAFIANQGDIPMEFRLRPERVGKRREHETREVFVPEGPFGTRPDRAKAALLPLEVDGCKGRLGDIHNGHRRRRSEAGGEIYEVLFERYVEEDPDDATA